MLTKSVMSINLSKLDFKLAKARELKALMLNYKSIQTGF